MIRENTDTYAVLCQLKGCGEINERDALLVLGVRRLSARINDLKNEGYKIKTVLKSVVKRSGRKVNVTDRYVLEGV
jgi:uncharacterized small protein (DUF1192 family)